MQRERLLSFLPKKTNCGHHVFRLSQQSLLKFNLTHSPLLVPSPALNADRSALARCCFMQNNTTYLQRPFLMALMWWPPDLQEEASWIPEFSSLSCFTALSERLQAKLPINMHSAFSRGVALPWTLPTRALIILCLGDSFSVKPPQPTEKF